MCGAALEHACVRNWKCVGRFPKHNVSIMLHRKHILGKNSKVVTRIKLRTLQVLAIGFDQLGYGTIN